MNPTDAEKTLPCGMQVAGFYKGTFQFEKKPADRDTSDVRFTLKDANDKVMFQNAWQPLLAIIQEKRKLSPLDAKICYYDIVAAPTPENSSFFTLNEKHKVFFRPAAAVAKQEDPSGKKHCHGHTWLAVYLQTCGRPHAPKLFGEFLGKCED